jgi:hypothetical protein
MRAALNFQLSRLSDWNLYGLCRWDVYAFPVSLLSESQASGKRRALIQIFILTSFRGWTRVRTTPDQTQQAQRLKLAFRRIFSLLSLTTEGLPLFSSCVRGLITLV